jgi:carbamoylphosphate synthase small subunit
MVFTGEAFGAEGEVTGEVVFNTSLSGYQENLTDPSYTGQIVTMTYPLICNDRIGEGRRRRELPVFCARYHSDASSETHESLQ